MDDTAQELSNRQRVCSPEVADFDGLACLPDRGRARLLVLVRVCLARDTRCITVVVDTLLRSTDGSFERFADVERYDGDPHQVEGAVLIDVDGKSLLTREEWDELDWLWPFLVQAVEEAQAAGEGERYFPDQPIRFRVERLPTGRFLVSVDLGDERRGASANAAEFVRAIAAAGLEFFGHRDRIIRGSGGDQHEADLCRRWLASSSS